MKAPLRLLLLAAGVAALPLVASAQPAKPAVRPGAKPAARPVARPAARPVAKPVPKPAAPAAQAVAQPAPEPAPAPAPPPAPARAASSASGNPFDVGTNAMNLGIGIGSRYSYGGGIFGGSSTVTPAFSISYERGIIQVGPGIIGGGIIVGYQQASYTYSTYKDKYSDFIVAVRGAFHYPVTPAFDAYGGVGLGIRHLGYSSNYSGPVVYDYGSTDATSNLFVGGRYFLTSSIGAFAELGYDQTYLKGGITAKF